MLDGGRINETSAVIIGAAMRVHSRLGPGLLESAYEACLAHELWKRGCQVAVQPDVPIIYDDVLIDVGYRADLVVNEIIIVELKALAKVLPVHEAQLYSYLKLSDRRLGLLINFHVPHLRDGIKRLVNEL